MSFNWLRIINCLAYIKDHRKSCCKIWCWWIIAPSRTSLFKTYCVKYQFSISKEGMISINVRGNGLFLSFTFCNKKSKAFPLNYSAMRLFSKPSKRSDFCNLNKTHCPLILFIIEAYSIHSYKTKCHPIFSLKSRIPFSCK
jgi:hypothetical protein